VVGKVGFEPQTSWPETRRSASIILSVNYWFQIHGN
jgi:hypothetical protein